MQSYLLQDWITLQGSSTVTVLTQSENDWLDLTGFQDIVTWLDVKEASGTSPVVAFQTAPTQDEVLFFNMGSVAISGPGLTTTVMLKETALLPLARWFRWQMQVGAAAWDITFRIWCAVNATGSNKPTLGSQ